MVNVQFLTVNAQLMAVDVLFITVNVQFITVSVQLITVNIGRKVKLLQAQYRSSISAAGVRACLQERGSKKLLGSNFVGGGELATIQIHSWGYWTWHADTFIQKCYFVW